MEATSPTLSAGFCCMKVTPPFGLNIPGYYEKRYADGVLGDLHIRAAAFSDGQNKAIFSAAKPWVSKPTLLTF